jgi:hypothetical protein
MKKETTAEQLKRMPRMLWMEAKPYDALLKDRRLRTPMREAIRRVWSDSLLRGFFKQHGAKVPLIWVVNYIAHVVQDSSMPDYSPDLKLVRKIIKTENRQQAIRTLDKSVVIIKNQLIPFFNQIAGSFPMVNGERRWKGDEGDRTWGPVLRRLQDLREAFISTADWLRGGPPHHPRHIEGVLPLISLREHPGKEPEHYPQFHAIRQILQDFLFYPNLGEYRDEETARIMSLIYAPREVTVAYVRQRRRMHVAQIKRMVAANKKTNST